MMKTKISRSEIVWIVIASLIGATGIVLALLGIVADYLPVRASENILAGSESYFEGIFHLSFTWAGVILVIVAAIIAAIFLSYYANRAERESERETRREQRRHLFEEVETKDSLEVTPTTDHQ